MNNILKTWLIAIITLLFSIVCFIAFSQTYKQDARYEAYQRFKIIRQDEALIKCKESYLKSKYERVYSDKLDSTLTECSKSLVLVHNEATKMLFKQKSIVDSLVLLNDNMNKEYMSDIDRLKKKLEKKRKSQTIVWFLFGSLMTAMYLSK
jgi:cbb3-type cytochrome oxidase subunit 3